VAGCAKNAGIALIPTRLHASLRIFADDAGRLTSSSSNLSSLASDHGSIVFGVWGGVSDQGGAETRMSSHDLSGEQARDRLRSDAGQLLEKQTDQRLMSRRGVHRTSSASASPVARAMSMGKVCCE